MTDVDNRPTGETGNQFPSLVNIREYFTLWLGNIDHFLQERDRRYEERYVAQEKAVLAALAAQEKLTSAAFASAEKAVSKAEDAQKDYNQRSNEFRGQLDDQAKLLMARTEAISQFDGFDKRLEDRDKAVEARLTALSFSVNHAAFARDQHNRARRLPGFDRFKHRRVDLREAARGHADRLGRGSSEPCGRTRYGLRRKR